MTIHFRPLRYFLLLSFVLFLSPVYAQKELLTGRWIHVTETSNEYLVKALGPLGQIADRDSIKAHILRDKLTSVAAYDMVFSKNDQCESQGVKFSYTFDGKTLSLNRTRYTVLVFDGNQLEICESGGNCNLFYKEGYYKKLTPEQLCESLPVTRYDSLLIRHISDKNRLAARKDLFKISALPRYSDGLEAVEDLLRKYLGDRYAGIDDGQSASSFTANLSFVIEPDGSTSAVGLDAMETSVYDAFVRVFDALPGKWIPFKKDGQPVPCKVEIPIRYNN